MTRIFGCFYLLGKLMVAVFDKRQEESFFKAQDKFYGIEQQPSGLEGEFEWIRRWRKGEVS